MLTCCIVHSLQANFRLPTTYSSKVFPLLLSRVASPPSATCTCTAILLAVLAAALYAVSTPVSQMLLTGVPPTMVAAFSVGGWSNGVLGT